MQGWETAIYTLSVQRPQPNNTNHVPTYRKKEQKRKTVGDKKRASSLGQ